MMWRALLGVVRGVLGVAASIAFAIVCTLFASVVWAEPPAGRGAYLVNSLAACAGCHTPKTPSGPGPLLSGGTTFGVAPLAVVAPNITPDAATGIGAWTDRQIATAIKSGLRPDGSRIWAPMPQWAYHAMADSDVDAIVAYLRTVPPVSHALPPPTHATKAPPKDAPTLTVSVADADDPLAHGRYIAVALSHCVECHTPGPPPSADSGAHIDEGGRSFRTAKGVVVAPGIRAADLRRFSDAQLKLIITKGIRPDGSQVEGPMPVTSYARFRPADLDSLVAFLRSDQALPGR